MDALLTPESVLQWVITGLVAFGGIKTGLKVAQSEINELKLDVRRLENKVFGVNG